MQRGKSVRMALPEWHLAGQRPFPKRRLPLPGRWRMRGVAMKPGNSGGAKARWSADKRDEGARVAKIDGNIYEPCPAKSITVRKLQRTLMAKAKTKPSLRFQSLLDKVWRVDNLRETFNRCRRKAGATGADAVSLELIERIHKKAGLREGVPP